MKRVVVVLLLLVVAAQAVNKKTLVIVDNFGLRNTHSSFLDSLKANGHDLTFAQPLDEPKLRKYGEYQFDNLILFAPSAEDLTTVNGVEGVNEFLNSGRNVIVAVNSNVSEVMRQVVQDSGITFDDAETLVLDHFNYDSSDPDVMHSRIAATNMIQSAVILPHPPNAPVIFSGIAQTAEPSRLLYPVLTGGVTTFSYSSSQRVSVLSQSVGTETLLVTALQMRNNARMIVSGSLDLFSNKFFNLPLSLGSKTFAKSGNEDFCAQIATWALNGHGLLRSSLFSHRLAGSSIINPSVYRIKDQIEFSVKIDQFDGTSQQWLPFVANDVQLEVVMIDPYIRATLKHDSKGVFYSKFVLPDVYGVFKFALNYHRLGYGNLEISEQVSVRPFKHNEFERFIPVAYPYYASAFSMMAGFFIFGLLFLYS